MIEILGVFEDRAQEEFLGGLVESMAARRGLELRLHRRRTNGCHLNYLEHHLRDGSAFATLLVGVDAGRLGAEERRQCLEEVTRRRWTGEVIWAVAAPGIEAWMMADREAVRQVVRATYGVEPAETHDPPRPRTEARAKQVLDDWITRLSGGVPPLSGGLEFAPAIAAALDPARVSPRHHADLRAFAAEIDRHLAAVAAP